MRTKIQESLDAERAGWQGLLDAWAAEPPAWWTSTELVEAFASRVDLPSPLVCARRATTRGQAVRFGQVLGELFELTLPAYGYRIARRREAESLPSSWRIVEAAEPQHS